MEEPLKSAKEGMLLVGEIIRAAGDNENVKTAVNNLGQTAVIVTKTINNALLPLAAINFAFDKARQYFQGKFRQELSDHTSTIPAEHIVEPKAYIAGPALQGLAYSHEEPNLKEMYLGLLATAMDGRIAEKAHPAFVEIIRQITSEEAKLISNILRSNALPTVEIRLFEFGKEGYNVRIPYLLNLIDTSSQTPVENPHLPVMIDNWIRLGLVKVTYGKRLTDDAQYAWVDQRPEVLHLRQKCENTNEVKYQKGILVRTQFGEQFAKAVGLA